MLYTEDYRGLTVQYTRNWVPYDGDPSEPGLGMPGYWYVEIESIDAGDGDISDMLSSDALDTIVCYLAENGGDYAED